jgi:hypothetical protein
MVAQRKQFEAALGDAAVAGQPADRLEPAPSAAEHGQPGLPAGLRSGIESLSGLPMGHVLVHYNSARPAELGALAFAQGHEIHLGPGQEQHLPHEAWHVVQQAQGRVPATMQLESGVQVNDNAALEREADVMGITALQRQAAAPDVAAAPALPTAATVQRKNLQQAGLAAGLTRVSDGKRALVGDGRDVNLYYRSADVNGDRTDGIVKAAELNAEVSHRVHDWGDKGQVGKRKGDPWEHNNLYTRPRQKLDTSQVPNLDPYFLYVTIRYGGVGELEQLDVVYQHAPSFTGYVEQIMDTSNPATKVYPSMFDTNTERSGGKLDTGNVTRERNLEYSNVHDQGNPQAIATLTGGGGQRNLDAYTKLAGEGARWQAVRDHARSLKDRSRFYTQARGEPTKVRAVDFVSLWLSWKTAFGKQSDISNAEFAKVLVDDPNLFRGKGVRTFDRTAMTADDYDLD